MSLLQRVLVALVGVGVLPFSLSFPAGAAPAAEPPARVLALDAKQQAALGIQTTRVQAAGSDVLLASAQVQALPGREVTVSAPYAGQLSRLLVGLGDRVGAGAGLAHFTSAQLGEARRQWDEARLNAQTAQAALAREQALLQEGLIPPVRVQLGQARLDAAQSALRAREAELHAAGVRLGEGGYASGVLLSPLQGVVAESFAAIGQRVEAGTVLFRLVDDRALQLVLQLSADKATRVRVGDEVAIDTRQARARITGVSPALQAGQNALARAQVTQRGQLALGESLSVTVLATGGFANGNAAPRAWRVPTRALSPWHGQSVLFVAQAQGLRAQPVEVLSSNDDVAVVRGGALAEGQSVAITGVAALRALLQREE